MEIKYINSGINIPWDFNVIIEISENMPTKYEFNKKVGTIFVDRFLHTSMTYPINYGFIPHTMAKDGDPCDAMVLFREPLIPCSVIRVRPIGVLIMEDEAGQDEKILCVPHQKIDPYYNDIKSYHDLPKVKLNQIEHFFKCYKDLEKDKWVKITGWQNAEIAAQMIEHQIIK